MKHLILTSNVLFSRNVRFEQYLQNMDHSLDFVSEALTTSMFNKAVVFAVVRMQLFFSLSDIDSKLALLKSNRVMTKRLDHLLHQNAIWSKTANPFQLTFSPYDPKNVRSTITSLGIIIHNGKRKINNNRSRLLEGNCHFRKFIMFICIHCRSRTNQWYRTKVTPERRKRRTKD